MRRSLFCFLAVIVLLTSTLSVLAQTQYGSMSLEELRSLQVEILKAMWAHEDWQQVKVPPGVYRVGEEIPEGDWNISNAGSSGALIEIGTGLDATKTQINYTHILTSEFLSDDHEAGWNVTLTKGQYILIDDPVYFTPQTKGQGFTFK